MKFLSGDIMRPWEIIKELQDNSGSKMKIEIMSTISGDEDNEFWQGVNHALDPFKMYHMKKLPVPSEYGTGVKWPTFLKLLNALANREITGNVARDTVQALASSCTEEQWEMWYKRILKKDLRCGVNVTTANKVIPKKWEIVTFDCQLASPLNDAKNEHIPEDAFIEAKYDGTRALWLIPKHDPIRCFSRNGKEYHNFGIITEVLESIREYPGFPDDGLVMDSEVISEDFQALMRQARRKSDANFSGVAMMFDVLPMNEFLNKTCSLMLKDRRIILEDLVSFLKNEWGERCTVELSYAEKEVNAREDNDLIIDMFVQQVEAGFEGIMIKDANSMYNYKRDRTWLKKKPCETHDLTITGIEAGKEGKKYENTLGAFIAEGQEGDKIIKTNVAGIPDALRFEVWNDPKCFIGSVIEVESDGLTKSPDHDYWSLRFSRFIRFRDDKN